MPRPLRVHVPGGFDHTTLRGNPVAAGLAKTVSDYRWSSHHCYAGTLELPWVTTEFGLGLSSSRQQEALSAYMRFMDCDPNGTAYPLDEIESERDSNAPFNGVSKASGAHRLDGQTLAALIDEACRRFVVTAQQLRSTSRDRFLMQVRAWITRRAMEGKVANLSQVARELRRDRATLRYATLRYPKEAE